MARFFYNICETKYDSMKRVLFKKGVAWLMLTLIIPLINFAQDKKIDIDINKKDSSQWYTQSWVWIVGAAVFILLLVALLRGGRRTE